MTITDPIYGDFDITEPVLLELLEEPAVLRAGKIMQGATTPIINGWKDFSRLEHCIGVMLMIRKLGGSIEEQIAGLIHDISHTAFSHVIDYVYAREGSQNYHEYIKDKIILESGIPAILIRYSFDPDYILNEKNFGLLERNSPALCADRIDYCLRSMSTYFVETEKARKLFDSLIVMNGEFIFRDQESAVQFAQSFYYLDNQVLAFDRNVAAYCVFADALQKAIKRNYLEELDFLQTDAFVMQKLDKITDGDLRKLLDMLTPSFQIMEVSENYDYQVKTKARWVNPKFVLSDGSVEYVFTVDRELENLVELHKERLKTPKYVRVFMD